MKTILVQSLDVDEFVSELNRIYGKEDVVDIKYKPLLVNTEAMSQSPLHIALILVKDKNNKENKELE